MKHTYSIILAVLLIVALAIPTFASENNYIEPGVYTFIDDPVIPDNVTRVPLTFFRDKSGTASYSEFIYGYSTSNGYHVIMYGSAQVYSSTSGWKSSEYQTIKLTSGQSVSTEFYTWFTSNLKPDYCDGTSCPANDANADGICDDCGMTLSLRLTGYPTLPDLDGNNKHTVLTQDSGGYNYYIFTSDSSYTASGTASTQLLVEFNNEVHWNIYRCTDGKSWYKTVSSSGYQYGLGPTSDTNILSSTFTFYDSDGNPFFPRPLWAEMEQVTQGEMEGLTAETLGTMKILVGCGVCLIALLISLILLKRAGTTLFN